MESDTLRDKLTEQSQDLKKIERNRPTIKESLKRIIDALEKTKDENVCSATVLVEAKEFIKDFKG